MPKSLCLSPGRRTHMKQTREDFSEEGCIELTFHERGSPSAPSCPEDGVLFWPSDDCCAELLCHMTNLHNGEYICSTDFQTDLKHSFKDRLKPTLFHKYQMPLSPISVTNQNVLLENVKNVCLSAQSRRAVTPGMSVKGLFISMPQTHRVNPAIFH